MKLILILSLFLFCNQVHAETTSDNSHQPESTKDASHAEAVTYFAQLTVIELWSSKTSEAFLAKSKQVKEGSEPAFFFSGAATIQQKTLSLLQTLPIPDATDVRDYHSQRLEAVKTLNEALTAGMNKNEDDYKRLQAKAMEMLRSTDKLAEQLKSKYHVTEGDVQSLVTSKKVDVQWMEPIIKAKP
jgi:hypothetical protein